MSCGIVSVFGIVLLTLVIATPVDKHKPLDCPKNEVYYKCSLEKCYKTCEQSMKSFPCPMISSDCFKPSCECKDNYLRNKEGDCVPEKDC